MGKKARIKKLAREGREQHVSVKQSRAAISRPAFPLLRVALIFAGLIVGLNLLHWFVFSPNWLQPLQLATAKVVATIVGLSGLAVQQQGTNLYFPNAHWEIIAECTAYSAAIVFVAFVLAYPASLKAKGLGVLLGIPVLFVANILRLVVLAWAERFFPVIATTLHDYVWQVAFLFLLVVMWLLWIEWIVKRETSTPLPD